MGDSSLEGLEKAGIKLIKQAVEHESNHRLKEALSCFTEGIDMLIQVNRESANKDRKAAFSKKIGEYIDHAEQLKERIAREEKMRSENLQVAIAEGSTGHTYQNLFGWCIDESVTEVVIEDPYIKAHHQVQNFIRFCELVLSKSQKKVKAIRLVTQPNKEKLPQKSHLSQEEMLKDLAENLQGHGVTLTVTFLESLHDREIRFNNGWTVKIGRGLDIYHKPQGKIYIGTFDCSFRNCKATTVDFISRTVNRK